jgi:hypothetical protein
MPNNRRQHHPGERFNSLTFVSEIDLPAGQPRQGQFKCDCGSVIKALLSKVRHGQVRRCKSCKADLLSESSRTYAVNNIFKNMQNPTASYILGLFMADGNARKNGSTLSLSLVESDRDILDKISEVVQPEKPLHYCQVNNGRNQFKLAISHKGIYDIFLDHGCVPNKSNILQWPQKPIDDKAFIRGYWDGDGHISKNKASVLGTASFLDSMNDRIKTHVGDHISFRRYKHHRWSKVEEMHIRFKDHRSEVLGWLYDGETFCLRRKKDAYIKFAKTN